MDMEGGAGREICVDRGRLRSHGGWEGCEVKHGDGTRKGRGAGTQGRRGGREVKDDRRKKKQYIDSMA